MLTREQLTTVTQDPNQADDLMRAVQGTIQVMRKLPFLKWSIPRVHPAALVDDTLGILLADLADRGLIPIPSDYEWTDDINDAAAKAFAEWRHFYELDEHGLQRTNPRDPSPMRGETHSTPEFNYKATLIAHGEEPPIPGADQPEPFESPVDLSMLNEQEFDILSMLGNGLDQREVAEFSGFVYDPAKPTWDHRAFVQAKLRTIRRKVCGSGVKTQAQAREWLATSTEVTT